MRHLSPESITPNRTILRGVKKSVCLLISHSPMSSSPKLQRIELQNLELCILFGPSWDEGIFGGVVVLDGNASILGVTLRHNVRYRFSDRTITVVCLGKTRLDVTGDCVIFPPQPIYTSLDALKTELVCASQAAALLADAKSQGPVILVLGGKESGKSTVCRHLANLFLSHSNPAQKLYPTLGSVAGSELGVTSSSPPWGVTVVDLSIRQNAISCCPGSIAAAFLESPISVDDDFSSLIPLVFFFGDKDVTAASRKRYLDICAWMHQSIQSLKHAKPIFRAGPVIVDTIGWTRDLGYDILRQLISIFGVTDVVVTGGGSSDAVADSLKADFAFMSGSLAIRRLDAYRVPSTVCGQSQVASCGSQQLHQYFFGTLRTPLSPTRLVVYLKDVVLLDARTLQEIPLRGLKPLSLAAVSTAPTRELCESKNVAGFVIITDIGKQTLTLLSPAPGKLPRPFLLVSDVVRAQPQDIPSLGAT